MESGDDVNPKTPYGDGMDIWIGTSGYSYPDWVGPFYPPQTRPGQMLAFYARHFPIVELNYTFYRCPTPAQLIQQTKAVPKGFQFLVKLPRTISHEERTQDLPLFRQAVEALRSRGGLLGLLCQLPQSHHETRPRRRWLEYLGIELGPYSLAVEFRHRSWAKPDVAPWLAKHNLQLVSVDAPDLPALYPRGLVQSTRQLYLRFHSRNSANWYLSDKERYDFDYDDTMLGEWVDDVLSRADQTETALLLFNNCQRSQAIENARRIEALFRQKPQEGIRIVPPLTSEGPNVVQRSLFEESDFFSDP